MAGRAPRIAIDLEANIAGLVGDLRNASTAVTQFTARARREVEQTSKTMQHLNTQVVSVGRFLKNSFAGLQTVSLLSTLTGLSDRYSNLDAKLKLVSRTQKEYNIAYAGTQQIARETFTSLEATVALYQRTSNAVQGLGVSQAEVLKITSTVNKAFLVSGATSEEASASIIQLTQALGSGFLRGQEFNSIAEQAPRLLKAIADSIGIPRGALKALANEGGITMDVLRKALTGPAADEIAKEAAQMPLTIERAFGLLRNSALVFVGESNKSTGAARSFADSLKYVAENFEGIANSATFLIKTGLLVYLARLGSAGIEYGRGVARNIQLQTAWAAAIREDSVRTAQAQSVKAAAALAEQKNAAALTVAKATEVKATQLAIAASQEEYMAKLRLANQTIAASEATIAATKAAGSQSFALREQARAELALAQAQAVRSASLRELATLGRQSARMSSLGSVASVAAPSRFSPTEIAATNASVQALVATAPKVGVLTTAFAKLGGVLSGLVGGTSGVALLGVYALYKAYSSLSDQFKAAKEAAQSFRDSLEDVSKNSEFVAKSLTKNTFSARDSISLFYESAAKLNGAKDELRKFQEQYDSLQASLGTGGREGRDLAIIGQLDAMRGGLQKNQAQVTAAQTDFDNMAALLRQRLGPAFDEVITAAARMNNASFDEFYNNLSDTARASIAQLDELGKKLQSTVAALPRTITEMQRKVRDTGLSAAARARNELRDLVTDATTRDSSGALRAKPGFGADYFNQITQNAAKYVATAAEQEAADKRLADAKKAVTAASKEQTAAARDAEKVEGYIDGIKAKTEQLKLEAMYGRNASEAEKDLIRFDYMLSESKNSVYNAREKEIRAILQGNIALENEARAREHALESAARELQVRRQISDFAEARARASEREIEALKFGGNTGELNQRLQQVSDEFRQQRKAIDDAYNQRLNELPDTASNAARRNELQQEYIRLIGVTVAAEANAAMQERAYFDERLKQQRDWRNGAVSAMQDYAASAQDVAGMTKTAFSASFSRMEDLVVQFVTTGKASFKDFVKSALTDFVRMETRILLSKAFEWVVNWAVGAFSGTSSTATASTPTIGPYSAKGNVFAHGDVKRFAMGNPFSNSVVNTPTMAPMAVFGEAGEEAIMPLARDSKGSLGIKAQMSGGASNVFNTEINTTINSDGSKSSERSSDSKSAMADQFSKIIEQKVSEGINKALLPGGPIYAEVRS